MSNCCGHNTKEEPTNETSQGGSCHPQKAKLDYMLWGSLAGVAILYLHFILFPQTTHFANWYHTLAHAVFELMNTMWWGLVLGIFMLALLAKVPREFVMKILGTNSGLSGILRATAAGVMLDLCSHGILMVGAKLYERGASIGQVMAFLIASPWNSFSLTLILIALIGLGWTVAFIVLSIVVAVITGVIFNALVKRGTLPANPNTKELPKDFKFWQEAKVGLKQTQYSWPFFRSLIVGGISESRMVLRWIFFGVLLAGLVRALIPAEWFSEYFGPGFIGLLLTIVAATVVEVCSEGSAPIAADLLTRASAPGNSFAFLMAGVATDYTEVMVVKETTQSWKIALFLPLICVPQVVLVAAMMNVV